ncbi:TonB-dependent siderophore receptor [Castellaniella defragrans]|uniref:Ferric enterobactin receptor n=1 Tax=Castellaniella defragrans TaxID=75697 RepID=A0A7W9TNL9_CASDE|nr:TonB-dependent siderophore receptor [Castellaniella defragrans]KAB0616661.1 TonB-dependent siderophore receptor [Castellaniella defragrans]MBB6084070.1 ferric enterobactin receptor [Castellaniella defragrans]
MSASKVQGRALPPLGLLIALGLAAAPAGAQSSEGVAQLDRVVVKAEQELKQTPGASTITSEDIQKSPPATDVSEIIRTMPGVNLTGNSSSGQRGNNRQIDIRGMGPENTLILIDGKPVSSRGSVRFGWRGERDTRGDTNWIPPEQIERIEVLRGPAAARYGNGAAGGVVNIITKPVSDTLSGSVSVYGNAPAHSDEGATARSTFSLSGPISDSLGFRLWGSAANFQGDAYDINEEHASPRGGGNKGTFPAGREGFKNRDLNGVLSWQPAAGHKIEFGAGYGRQGNVYVGDTQNTNTNAMVKRELGGETNRVYRQAYSITHTGDWNADTHTLSYLQYEHTRNSRLLEGLAGGTEGAFNDPTNAAVKDGGYGDINLRTLTAHTELSRRLNWGGIDQMGTFGLEWVRQDLEDYASDLSSRNAPSAKMPVVPFAYQPKMHANIYSVFAEDNLYIGERWTVTPGLRFDHHSLQGNNWSPSLNLSYMVNDQWTVKAGIARAYKAPNLYQSNSGYLLYSAGNGCWGNSPGGTDGCFLLGNSDLKAETSINKELGIEFRSPDGLGASLTYFHNDYRDKIEAGRTPIGSFVGSTRLRQNIFQWENVPRAVVQGIEGNLTWPFARDWLWSTNFTYMIESKNKETGEHLSTIPEYTINSTLDWSVTPAWSLRAKATVYGEQEGPKYDYYGQPLTGSATDKIPPYALFGLSTQYKVNKHLRVTAGVDNLFDKRIFRRGNAIGVNMDNANYIYGAGAYTYNQPGRVFFMEVTSSF